MKHRTVLMTLAISAALVLPNCAALNHPRCRAHDVTGFPAWPHQGEWQSGRTTLPYSCWLPSPPRHPRAVVIMAEGWDSSGRDYDSIGRRLADEGYVVYASENRCGQNDSNAYRRGSTPASWHDWVEDLRNFTGMVRARHRGVPFFYHGHSMGCLVAIQAIAEMDETQRPSGLILHSPALPLMSKDRRLLLNALLLPVGWLRVPHLCLMDPEKNGPFSEPEMNCRWMKSPDRVRRGYEIEFVRKAAGLGHKARLASGKLAMPVLAMGGGSDWINVRTPNVQQAYIDYLCGEVAGGPESAGGHGQCRFYPEGYHVLTEGPTRNQALNDIVHWLNARCSNSSPASNNTSSSPLVVDH